MANNKIKIFISSPGDVGHERLAAIRVIEKLQGEFYGYAELQPILWEYEPLKATAHFQEQIVTPSSTDIVICILWARLGTKLPKNFIKEDGTDYFSGTEWEFEDAVKANINKGIPDILVYKKTIEPSVKETNSTFFSVDQRKALNSFIDKWFHSSTNDFNALFQPFDDIQQFEEALEHQLRKLIKERIPDYVVEEEKIAITWYKGSPYKGLQFFDETFSKVFYGRAKDIGRLKDAFLYQQEAGCSFVLVLGSSGSGKSSLARAGILPVITQYGVIDGVDLWIKAVISPSEISADLIHGVLQKFGFEFLKLEKVFKNDLTMGINRLKDLLQLKSYEEKEKNLYTRVPRLKIFLVVDQLEELFTNPLITSQDKIYFISFLHALSGSGDVWILANMRSDFYEKTAELPELMEMKKDNGQYHLLPPNLSELGQIIQKPAKAAGLSFEADSTTENNLSDVLQEEASNNSSSLPLLEFTLNELYKRKNECNVLTFQAYKEIGGLKGAISCVAEATLGELSRETADALPGVFRQLISLNEFAKDGISAKKVPESQLCNNADRKKLAEAFIDARLFVIDSDDGGNKVITVAHEALITHWERIRQLIELDREFLKTREELLFAMNQWKVEGKKKDFLIPSGSQLKLAAGFLSNRHEDLSDELTDFIECSLKHQNKKHQIAVSIAAIAALILIIFSILGYNQWNSAQMKLQESRRQESIKLITSAKEDFAKENRLSALKNLISALPKNVNKPDRPLVQDGVDLLYNVLFTPKQNDNVLGLLTASSSITDYTFSNKGDKLLVSCTDGTLTLYSSKTLNKISQTKLNAKPYIVHFTKDDSKILVLDDHNHINLFSGTTLESIKVLNMKNMPFKGQTLTEGDLLLFSDGSLKESKGLFLLDINTGNIINYPFPFEPGNNVFVSNLIINKNYIAVSVDGIYIDSASTTMDITLIFDRNSGKQIRYYETPAVVKSSMFIDDKTLRVLYSDGKIFDINLASERLQEQLYFDMNVKDIGEISSSKDMSIVAAISSDGIYIADTKTKKWILRDDYTGIKDSTLSQDGKYFMFINSSDGSYSVFNLEKGIMLAAQGIVYSGNDELFECGFRYNPSEGCFVNRIGDNQLQLIKDGDIIGWHLSWTTNIATNQFSYTARFITVILDNSLVIKDTKKINETRIINLPENSSFQISVNKNYGYVTTLSDGIWVVDLETGEIIRTLKGKYILAQSNKDNTLAVRLDDSDIVLYDLKNNKEYIIKINFAKGDILDLAAFDYNNSTFALQFSRADNENFEIELWDYKNGVRKNSFFTKEISKDEEMDSLTFSLDGSLISIGTNLSGRRVVYDAKTSALVEDTKESFNYIYFKDKINGEMFLRWGGLLNKTDNGFKITKSFYEKITSLGAVREYVVSPSRKKLLVLYDDSTLIAYDLVKENQIIKINGSTDLADIAFNEKEDGLRAIYEAFNGSKIQEFPFLSPQEIIDKARNEITG